MGLSLMSLLILLDDIILVRRGQHYNLLRYVQTISLASWAPLTRWIVALCTAVLLDLQTLRLSHRPQKAHQGYPR